MSSRCRQLAFGLLLVSASFARPALAGNSGAVVSIHPEGFRLPLLTVAEPDSGALVILAESRTGTHEVYVQRLDRHGRALLGESGTYLMPYDNQNYSLQLIEDGTGGAILAKSVDRGATGLDIVVWRVAPDGSMAYGTNGIVVCSANRDQTRPFLASGPSGSYYVAWSDDRANAGGRTDNYAQRMSLAGAPLWAANGTLINTATYRPWSYGIDAVVSDRQGGLLMTWTYNSYGGVTRAQRVSSSGVLQWTANGVDFGDPNYGVRGLAPDGLGGAWGMMTNWSGSATSFAAYHMAANGTPAFAGGVAYLPPQYNGQSVIIRNATGGCFIYTAATGSSNQTASTVYRQEISAAGAVLRGPYGEYMTTTSLPRVVDAGSAFLTAAQEPTVFSPRKRFRVQKVGFDGMPQLPGTGVVMGRIEGSWLEVGIPPQVAMGPSGVIAASWADVRYLSPGTPEAIHTFGQAFSSTGTPLWNDAEEPTLLTARDAEGDQGGFVRVTWAPSVADHPAARAAAGYRVWRALPPSASAPWTGTERAEDGLFRSDGRTYLALASTYWELAGEQSAGALPGYACAVTTGRDSTASSPADEMFMVEAYDDSSHHWYSGTLTAHSVDNLAPAMVPSAAGYYSGGTTSLYWGGVSDADLAGYEVFRGSTPSFTPSDANRIASTTGVTWIDPAGTPAAYRIAARDVHGNLGPSALVLPAGTLGAEPHVPHIWRLQAEWRSGSLRLALDVPRADRGRVEVFDVSGRRVWETAFTTESARALEYRATPSGLRSGILYVRATSTTNATLTRKVVALP